MKMTGATKLGRLEEIRMTLKFWKLRRKIVQMPGAERTPVNALAATLEKAHAGHIKSVYIGIEWDDGSFCGDWSQMLRKDLAVHALVAQQNALNEFDQGGEAV